MKKWGAALLLALAAPAGAAGLQPAQFEGFAFRQHPGAQMPLNIMLRDESGQPVRLGSLLDGKPAVLVLEYLHCPNLCGLVLAGLVHDLAAAKLTPGRDVQFIAISIDPNERPADAASARANYARLYGTRDLTGWHFLTGQAPAVHQVADAVGFRYKYDPSIRQFAHPAGFVVLTPGARISRYLLGFAHGPDEMRAAVAEAGRGTVEPPAHPLLLLCLGYDPQSGTVAWFVMQALRLAAAVTVAACIWYVVAALRRERARS